MRWEARLVGFGEALPVPSGDSTAWPWCSALVGMNGRSRARGGSMAAKDAVSCSMRYRSEIEW